VNIIIAAVVGGIVLIWGGIIGLLKVVDMFERKHIYLLGAYSTLVASSVMGLVLYTNYERQKEHRQDLTNQMNEFSTRLNALSTRLVAQLEEKANLTQSEFEVRRDLQNERTNHKGAREELSSQIDANSALESKLAAERRARMAYQQQINKKLEERLTQEDKRYRDLAETHRRAQQNVQKQLSATKDDLSKLNTKTASITSKQNTILGKINTTREIQDLTAQKLDALARNQASLYDDLTKTMAEIDSLYSKEFKKK
jgi:chromosome segregation ATPase